MVLLPLLLLRENRNRQSLILVLPTAAWAVAAAVLMRMPFAAGFLGAAASVVASVTVSMAVVWLLAERLAAGIRPVTLLARTAILMAAAGPVALLVMGQTGGTFLPGLLAHLVSVVSITAALALAWRRGRRRGTARAFVGWTVLFSGLAQLVLCVVVSVAAGIFLAVKTGQCATSVAVPVGGGVLGFVSGLTLAALVCCSFLPAMRLSVFRSRLDRVLGMPARVPPPPPPAQT